MTKKEFEFTRSSISQVIDDMLASIKQAENSYSMYKKNKTRVTCTLYDKDGISVKVYRGRQWVKELKNDMYQIAEGYIDYKVYLGYTK